jgi:hypothetical protein
MLLPLCLLLLAWGEPVRVAEICELEVAGPLWHDSRLVAATRAKVYASICAALPPVVVAAAEQRGRHWTRGRRRPSCSTS